MKIKIKKSIFFAIFVIGATFFIGILLLDDRQIFPISKKVVAKKTPHIYIIPHQDDELFMAGSIIRSIENNPETYLVLVSDGANSYAKHILNGKNDSNRKVYCKWHQIWHNPKKEGYQLLSEDIFSQKRNEEFASSLEKLGINSSNIIYLNTELTGLHQFKDSTLSNNSDKAIQIIYDLFGSGIYTTLSGGHQDHEALAQSLRNFTAPIEKRFVPLIKNSSSTIISLNEIEMQKKRQAIAVYSLWEPKNGHLAIGLHSAPEFINIWKNQTEEWINVD